MGALSELKPKDLFEQFEKLSQVPRGSGKTDGVVKYLKDFAKARNLECMSDDVNNVLIRKPASKGYENAGAVILQAHHDMVWAKKEGNDFDFENEGIKLIVEDDWIRADGTTLGGDDGIGVAMMLAILDDDTLSHPALEMLFTADEEIGMPGAFGFDCTWFKGRRLINLDSESADILMCGCAGGINVYSSIPMEKCTTNGTLIKVEIKDMKSGHSGIEIDKGRGNAIEFMARMLYTAAGVADIKLIGIDGGVRDTAIAPFCTMSLIASKENADKIVTQLSSLADALKIEYATTEPTLDIAIFEEEDVNAAAFTDCDTKKLSQVLISVPNGVLAMSNELKGLVQTSTNIGKIETTDEGVVFGETIRSSVASQKVWIVQKVKAAVALAGGTTVESGDYPGWAFNPNSGLKNIMVEAYKELYNEEPFVEAVHAGLECGIFASKVEEGLDCVAYGPQMDGVHTAEEKLSISSTAKTFAIVKKTLAMCK